MTQVIGEMISPCSTPLLTRKVLVGPNGELIDTSLFVSKLIKRLVKEGGHMILSMDFLMAGIGAESNALAMSSKANQNSLLLIFAACMAESTMVKGSKVL